MALINDNNRTYVAQATLRYFVPRVMQVAERQAGNPAVKAAATSAVQKGEYFAQKFDARENAELRRGIAVKEGTEQTTHAEGVLRSWLPTLAGRFSIATAAFTPAGSRPEDVSVAIRRLLTFVEEQSAGDTAPDVQQALTELRSAGEVVEAKWRESRASLIEAQTSAQQTRDAAVEFHRSLVILRRVLVTVLGRRHLDYQTLRYTRVSQDEESVEVLDDTSTADTGNPVPAEGDRDSGEFTTVKAEAS